MHGPVADICSQVERASVSIPIMLQLCWQPCTQSKHTQAASAPKSWYDPLHHAGFAHSGSGVEAMQSVMYAPQVKQNPPPPPALPTEAPPIPVEAVDVATA